MPMAQSRKKKRFTMLLASIGPLNAKAVEIYENNIKAGWWKRDPETQAIIDRNPGELLALVHSELSEAYYGEVSASVVMDDHLPNRLMPEVELADTAIRTLDIAGHYKTDLDYLIEVIDRDDLVWEDHDEPIDPSDYIAYAHYTVSCALEGVRKNAMSTIIPGFTQFDVSLARLIAVIFEYAEFAGYDIMGAMEDKLEYNKHRADHKLANRQAEGGKKF